MPMLKIGAHYDLFKEDEATGNKTLVQTSRLCHVCMRPLTGVIVPVDGDRQVHIECKRSV